jgi:hypothetical protein
MAQVIVPQKKKNEGLSEILTLGGAAGGAMLGGPGGAMAGASLGASLGGVGGSLISQNQPQGTAGVPGAPSQSMAMQRRSQQLGTDNLMALTQAEKQLPNLPEDLRQQYAPAIIQARMLEQKQRGLA